jgi:hypothetical protein
MGAEHKGIRRRRIREESAPSHADHFGIDVSPRSRVRMVALDRVVQDITGDQAAVADTASTNPAPITGCTESSNAGAWRPSSECAQQSTSAAPNRYRARGNIGIQCV